MSLVKSFCPGVYIYIYSWTKTFDQTEKLYIYIYKLNKSDELITNISVGLFIYNGSQEVSSLEEKIYWKSSIENFLNSF